MLKFFFSFIYLLLSITKLQANELELDAAEIFIDKNQDITATENVNVDYLEHNLKAEFLKYFKSQEKITAREQVRYYNNLTKEKLRAIAITTDREFNNLSAENVLYRLSDNSTIIAKKITKKDHIIKLKNGSFTTCRICNKAGKKLIPQWRIYGHKITRDEKQQNFYFTHAFFKIYGVPILYLPFFIHPTEDVKKRSGFLAPSYESDSVLNNQFSLPIFINLASNYDLTYTPTFFSKGNVHHAADFRYLDEKTNLELNTNFVRENSEFKERLVAEGINPSLGNNSKWFASLESNTRLKNNYNLESNIFAVSDRAYLERFQRDFREFYSSNVNLNKFSETQEFHGEINHFHEFDNAAADSFELPNIVFKKDLKLKKYQLKYNYALDYNHVKSDANAARDRLAFSDFLGKRTILKNGVILDYGLSNNLVVYNNDSASNQAIKPRYIPELKFAAKQPLLNRSKFGKFLLTPEVKAVIAPKNLNSEQISNFDGATTNLNYSNVLTDRKISGYDLVEQGTRISYGFNKFFSNNWFDFENFFGQNYYFNEQTNLERVSGLQEEFSDLVGRAQLEFFDKLRLSYNYKLKEENFIPYHNQYNLSYLGDKLSSNFAFTNYKYNILDPQENRVSYLNSSVTLRPNERYEITLRNQRNLLSRAIDPNSGSVRSALDLRIKGDCVDYLVTVARNNINTENNNSDLAFTFNFVIADF